MNLIFASMVIGAGIVAFYYIVCGLKKPAKERKDKKIVVVAPSGAFPIDN